MLPNYPLASPMRPRALLDATATCLLLAAATVSAEAQKRVAPQKAPAAQRPAWAPLKAESTRKAWEQPPLKVLDPLGRAGSTLKAPERPLAEVPNPQQLELLHKIVPGRSPGFQFVEVTVKRFSQDFEDGARHPDVFLREVRSNQPELVKEWEEAPKDKRIFIIGAGQDSARVSEQAASLKSDGYAVFFYDFCRPLCSSKAVGAMFGTSGQTMLYHTPFADLSEYVAVEVATARYLEGLEKQLILVSTADLLALHGSKFAIQVAETGTPTPFPVK